MLSRRNFLHYLLVCSLYPWLRNSYAQDLVSKTGNFSFIYDDPKLKQAFYNFLDHVFHLYPTQDFHDLIANCAKTSTEDKTIYQTIEQKLPDIKPFLSELKYALPSLKKQKKEMLQQSHVLLGSEKSIKGYLEVGTPGRYVAALKKKFPIHGDIYIMDEQEPSYSPQNIVERGQLIKSAEYIPMNNYQTNLQTSGVSHNSLDLISVFIGFHHCPIDLRESFIASLRAALKTGGKLLLRDHDVHNESMQHMVSLAHDVFNVGTGQSWNYNAKELRHFYSLAFISDFLEQRGFKKVGPDIYQKGDPTKNALMLFTKV